jgi:hypothetical protein
MSQTNYDDDEEGVFKHDRIDYKYCEIKLKDKNCFRFVFFMLVKVRLG